MDSSQFWLGVGIGLGANIDHQGEQDPSNIAFSVNTSLKSNNHLFSARFGYVAAYVFGDEVRDLSILYGRAIEVDRSMFSFGMGVGKVDGTRNEDFKLFSDEDTKEPFGATGLALELQIRFVKGRHGGLGLYGFGNVNKEMSFFGATIALQLGDLD